jgi:hypothetical protein
VGEICIGVGVCQDMTHSAYWKHIRRNASASSPKTRCLWRCGVNACELNGEALLMSTGTSTIFYSP